MLANQTRPRTAFQPQPHHHQPAYYEVARQTTTTPFHADAADLDFDFDGAEHNYNSQSSSPISTQSILSQYSAVNTSPLSTFDSIPTITVPRGGHGGSLFNFSPQSNQSALGEALFANTDPMQTDSWILNGQLTPRAVGRVSHHRESSLSSLGSTGPASPYSHNTSNPQIAVTDSMGDGYGLANVDDLSNYQLAKFPSVTHDTFFTSYPNYASADTSVINTYPQLAAATPRRKNDRGLLPPPEHPIGPNRSRPVSVASSVASDSPATPAGDFDDERRQRNVVNIVPKFERTMTDAYADELYSPSFTVTSASSVPMPVSPSNELFVQRMQAANSQHLSANSPVSATARDRSPFRQGSPLALMPMHDFSQMRFGSAQQMREHAKAAQDARAVQQQMSHSVETSAPQTISPKDALLDFHEGDGDANFPLFPPQGSNGFDANTMNKAVSRSQQAFDSTPMDTTFNNFLGTQLPTNLQIPQQYPFIAQPQQPSSVPSLSNGSLAPSRMSSADVGSVDTSHSNSPQRPASTTADGGTYTCTYHGCKLRFETPALLQKHKREGHRQAHGINGARRPESAGSNSGMTSSLLNSQAGPHKCDRINPGTGKPCNTIFSRPYDLTRHEDTIHNARKQKVRCDLCTDEKTFSRADALTRHYRVCHPDIEFPGKHRRRGGQSG